jgi:subtilase family serine protease
MAHQYTPMMESLEKRVHLSVVKSPVGLTPQQVRHAYNVDKIWYKNRKTGITYKGTGEGQTVAIVDAYDHPRVTSDFKIFNKQFGLPNYGKDGKLLLQKKVAPSGRGARFTLPVPPLNRGWAEEISLDVQWAHVIAPRAKIILVEAQSNSNDDILTAIDFARNIPGVSVVSLSLGIDGELGSFQESYDNYFTTPKGHIAGGGIPGGISYVVSSGDNALTSWPAVSKNAIGIGGTTLTVDAAGNWLSETAWSQGGGGPPIFTIPNDSPDVSMVADPASGVAVYNSVPNSQGNTGWEQVGGTSASAPMWGGLLAVINEGRTLLKKPSLDGVKDVIPWLSTKPSSSFHDIVTGSNGYDATPGVDYVTGIGTPKAHKVARDLILWDRPIV